MAGVKAVWQQNLRVCRLQLEWSQEGDSWLKKNIKKMNLLICLPLFLSYAVPSSCGLMTALDKSEEIPKSTVEVLIVVL